MRKPYAVADALRPVFEQVLAEGTADEGLGRLAQELNLKASSDVFTVRRKILASLYLYRIRAAWREGKRYFLGTRSEALER